LGLTKTEIFTAEQNELATIAKALGHPARIAILQHLLKINSCICGDLVEEIGLAQATISQHLRELKRVGIIQGTIEGTSVCYCIDPSVWLKVSNAFAGMFAKLKDEGCC
jgi:DNA-binding transcriptional ArsR family regulator